MAKPSDSPGITLENMIGTSGLAHLLNSTDGVPSYIEIASLKEGAAAITATISALKLQLQVMEDLLARHQAALAPIRRVPLEILTEILGYVISKRRATGNRTRTAVLNISLVSRAWHAASYKHWSRFYKFIKTRNGIPCKKIRAWFSNARNAPKELGLGHITENAQCGCHDPAVKCVWSNPEFPALLSSTAVKNLGLTFSSPACFQSLTTNISAYSKKHGIAKEASWGPLYSLDLALNASGIWPGATDRYRDALAQVPKGLKSLNLDFGAIPLGVVPPKINVHPEIFSTLTFITIKCNWDSPFILSLLAHCATIQDLWLNFYDGKHTWSKDLTPLELPNVRRLKLVNVNSSTAEKTLRLLRLPSLMHLKVDYGTSSKGSMTDLRQILEALNLYPLHNQTSTVRQLGLKHMTADDTQGLWDILSHFPYVEDIALDDVAFDARVLLTLHRRHIEESGALKLPYLHQFDIHGPPGDFDLESFLLYLKDRRMTRYSTTSGKIESSSSVGHVHNSAYINFEKESPTLTATLERCSSLIQELKEDFKIIVDVAVGRG